MRSNSLLSPGLLKSWLRRFWPLWLAGLVILVLQVDVPLYGAVTTVLHTHDSLKDKISEVESFWTFVNLGAWAFGLVAGLVVSVALDEQLFDSRAATFVGSLPLRRRTVFVTQFAAGLLPLVVIPALVGVSLLPLHIMAGVVFPLGSIARWFALSCALSIAFYALAQLACQLAGSRPVAVLLYGVINFLITCLEVAARMVIQALMYGISGADLHLTWLSPGIRLFEATLGDGTTPDWAPLGIYLAAACGIALLSCLLYERRSLETAGDSVSFAPARPVLKYLAGVSMALLFSTMFCLMVLSGSAPAAPADCIWLAAMLTAGGALGILFAEMIMSRSTHVLNRCWHGALALAALALVFVGASRLDVLGRVRYVPDPARIASASLDCSCIGRTTTFASPDNVAAVCELQRDVIAYGGTDVRDDSYQTLSITYLLDDETVLHRSYPINADYYDYAIGEAPASPGSKLIDRVIELANSTEGRTSRFADVLSGDPSKLVVEIEYRQEDDTELAYRTITLPAREVPSFVQQALSKDLMGEAGSAFTAGVQDADGNLDASLYVYLPLEDGYGNECLIGLTLSTKSTPAVLAWLAGHHPDLAFEPLSVE